jgi:hypothetical protein
MAIKMAKRKKNVVRKGRFADEMYIGPEPEWEGAENWNGEKYYRERTRVIYYYRYFYSSSDFKSWIVDWMETNGYEKKDIDMINHVPDYEIGASSGGYAKALRRGMPENHTGISEYLKPMQGLTFDTIPDATEIVKTDVTRLIELGSTLAVEKEAETKKTSTKYRPSIQYLLQQKALEMSEEIEDFVSDYDNSKEMLVDFDPQRILLIAGAKPNHLNVISKLYAPMLADLDELINPPNLKKMDEREQDMHEQLKECYANLSKADIKNQHKMYLTIITACENMVLKAKASKAPRKKKAISKEKMISKFKYLDHHTDTKSISVHPSELIGANAAIVYNSKTRKVGIYYASNIDPTGMGREGSGLSVKGTTIIGFNEAKSVQKTLRKPIEQLPKFRKATKRSLPKEFEAINSVEIKMNGRFNEHSLIIKVF